MATIAPRDLTLALLRAALYPVPAVTAVPEPVEGVEGPVDWPAVFSYATSQGIAVNAFDGYIAAYSDILPMSDAVKEAWLVETFSLETLAIAQRDTSSGMAATFAKNGLQTYVLKGEVISECYPIPSHRKTLDLDCFLIPTNREGLGSDNGGAWEKGNSLMEKEGIEVTRDFYKHSAFKFPLLKVENHQFFTPFRGDKLLKKLEILLQSKVKADPGQDKIDGTELLRPPVMVSALFILEHALSHFLLDGLSIRHVIDWMLFWRRHEGDIDKEEFERYVDEFRFRAFLDSLVAAGEFILGEREYSSLSDVQRRFLDSVLDGMYDHDDTPGLKRKLQTARNIIRSTWRYHAFSPMSMPKALWIKVKGFLFDKNPSL